MNPEEVWRLLAVGVVLVMGVCGVYLFLGYRAVIPDELRKATYPFAALLALVASAIIINFVSPIPPTPGVKVFAFIGVLCALYTVHLTAKVIRHRD